MNVTEVRMTLRDEEKLKAFANITFDDCFVVRGIKVIQGKHGLFVVMPGKKRKNGTFQDLAYPINNELRIHIEKSIIDHYHSILPSPQSVAQSDIKSDSDEDAFYIEDHAPHSEGEGEFKVKLSPVR